MYKFKIVQSNNIYKTDIVYLDDEYSFTGDPWISSDVTFVIGPYIQMGIGSSDKTVRIISGLSPHNSWYYKKLNVPSYKKGILLVESKLKSGFATNLKETENWPSKFDPQSGWFCIGDDITLLTDSSVEFATNIIAVLDIDSHLKALWLKPKFRPGFDIKSALQQKNR